MPQFHMFKDYGVASAALKVVAVASMMELEEFHMHRWMFVQDAVHASVAPPLDSDEAPQASAMFQPYSVRFLQQALLDPALGAFAQDARRELVQLFPELAAAPTRGGIPSARPILTKWEAALVA